MDICAKFENNSLTVIPEIMRPWEWDGRADGWTDYLKSNSFNHGYGEPES